MNEEIVLEELRALAACYRWLEKNSANRRIREAFAKQAAAIEDRVRCIQHLETDKSKQDQ